MLMAIIFEGRREGGGVVARDGEIERRIIAAITRELKPFWGCKKMCLLFVHTSALCLGCECFGFLISFLSLPHASR